MKSQDPQSLDLILYILKNILRYDSYKVKLSSTLADQSELLYGLQGTEIKKFLIKLLEYSWKEVIETIFFKNLVKIYLLDPDTAVFSGSLKLAELYILAEKNRAFIDDLKEYLEIASEENGTCLLRYFDFLILTNKHNITYESIVQLFKSFFIQDDLTKLALIAVTEEQIETLQKYLPEIIKQINYFEFFQEYNLSEEVTKRYMIFLSKIIAFGVEIEEKILKNVIALTYQLYQDKRESSEDYSFAFVISCNLLSSELLAKFVMSDENNKQFNFKNAIIDIIENAVVVSDPKTKINGLEILSFVFGNILEDSLMFAKEIQQFLVESMGTKSLFAYLNTDFKKHDYEEFEEAFLSFCIVFSTREESAEMLSEYNFILYLLNRRNRPSTICQKKYDVVGHLTKSKAFENLDKDLRNQFIAYLNKGVM